MSANDILVEFNLSGFNAIVSCLFMAIVYVGSLYVWGKASTDRYDPLTIKKRFLSVLIVCVLSPVFLWFISSSSHDNNGHGLLEWLGVRFDSMIMVLFCPLILTMILFFGPLALQYQEGYLMLYSDINFWCDAIQDIYWLRSHVMAPLTEEFIFRACMLPILIPPFGPAAAIMTAPLLFGVAHFHHAYEMVSQGQPLKEATFVCGFQFIYTTLFGIYSGYLFVRTGSLLSIVIVHAFCNHMGFPDFSAIFLFRSHTVKLTLMVCFVLGPCAWYCLLTSLTEPALYANYIYNLTIS